MQQKVRDVDFDCLGVVSRLFKTMHQNASVQNANALYKFAINAARRLLVTEVVLVSVMLVVDVLVVEVLVLVLLVVDEELVVKVVAVEVVLTKLLQFS